MTIAEYFQDVINSYVTHIYVIGFLIALVWRFINIRNNNLNIINDKHPSRYVDTEELKDSIKDYTIDWVMLYIECSVGALTSIVIASLLVIINLLGKVYLKNITYDIFISFTAIPGYSFFIHIRDLSNKYVVSKISKSFWE
jgi:hypothetical protein